MFSLFSKEKPDISNEVPFQKLEKIADGKYAEIKVAIDNPDVVVKEARTKWGRGVEHGVHPLADPVRMQEDMDMLQKNFGEYIPPSMLVIGKNERGEKTVYTVQDRVEGKDLNTAAYDENIAEQLKSFLKRVVDTFISNLVYRGNELWPQSLFPDLKPGNFIFGKDKKRGDENDKLYFVDTYPIEETHAHHFVTEYIPMIKRHFPQIWHFVINDFKEEAAERIKTYIQGSKDKIMRV